jgi:hypothetical protein
MDASLINTTRDVFNQTRRAHQHGSERTEAEPTLPRPARRGQIGAR